MIDWSEPLEAVHEDGRVVAVSKYDGGDIWPDDQGQYHVMADNDLLGFFNQDGSLWGHRGRGWRIRNVQPALSEVKYDDALVERMVALVVDISDCYNTGDSSDKSLAGEAYLWMRRANEIKPLLPTPIDPDLVKAREIAAEATPSIAHLFRNGDLDHNTVACILAGIKYGRGA